MQVYTQQFFVVAPRRENLKTISLLANLTQEEGPSLMLSHISAYYTRTKAHQMLIYNPVSRGFFVDVARFMLELPNGV